MKKYIASAILILILAEFGWVRTHAQETIFTIENCVNQFDMDKAIISESGYRYWFIDKNFIDGRTLKMSVVKPNQATHPPHSHEADEFFFVLEGKARFYLDGKTAIAGPYTSFYCPPGLDHGISNAGDTELKYLVIKKYPIAAIPQTPAAKRNTEESSLQELNSQSQAEHWGILDHSWIGLVHGGSDEWFASEDAIRVAENVLLYQRDVGGWPKNIPMHHVLTNKDRQRLEKLQADSLGATIDNGATTTELDFLSRMYAETEDDRYRISFLKGLDYLLDAQYDNGGWPQSYPVQSGKYSAHITFNDDAMVHVMEVMKDIAEGSDRFSIEVDENRIVKAREAFEKGLNCILKTQYLQNGILTAWCAQHDEVTLQPAQARSYELPSLSGSESVDIVELLMKIDNPSEEIINSIESAITWFEKVKITGIRIEKFTDEQGNTDRRVVEDKTAPPMWARFYGLSDNRPFFCDRDGIKKYSMSDISAERRNGYGWYSSDPNDLLKKYRVWRQKNN